MKDFARIGLSAGLNTGKNDAPRERGKAYVMNDYIESVVRAGAVPVMLPVLSDNGLAEKLFDMVDGLILTGGGDLDPFFYGEDPHVKLGSVCRLRDEFEFKLLDFAVKKIFRCLASAGGISLLTLISAGLFIRIFPYPKDHG